MEHTKRNGRGYFAAANTGEGFISYFDRIFVTAELSRLTVLKGGSGTGKSSFLKKLGRAAEDAGYTVEYFYCSSDPSSLDGLLYKKNGRVCGALDGTAPHLRDAELVGACDTVYNLAEYLSEELLIPRREEIAALQKRKKELYSAAYLRLAAAANAENCRRKITEPYIDREKMSAAATRLLKGIRGEGKEILRPTDSIGVVGRVRLDSLALGADKIYRVVGADSAEFLSALVEEAKKSGVNLTLSPSLSVPSLYSAVLTDGGERIAFTAEEKGYVPSGREKCVNMERFVKITDRADGARARESARMREKNLAAAAEILSEVGRIHKETEKIYIAAMDFDAKDKKEENIIEKLL